MKPIRILVLGAAVGCAGLAVAQERAAPPPPPFPDAALGRPGQPPRFPQSRADALARARARFAAVDRDHDGFITRAELAPPRAPEPDRKRDLFAELDKNGDGQISRSEFDSFPVPGGRPGVTERRIVIRRGEAAAGPGEVRTFRFERRGPGGPGGPDGPGELGFGPGRPSLGGGLMFRVAFDRFDANHDGRISAAEAEGEAAARFDRLDANHDGTLTWAESWMGGRAMAMRLPPPGAAPPSD